METSGYNLRQRPFLVSTTTDSLATIVTSSVSTVMPYPPAGSSGSTGGSTPAPTKASCVTSDFPSVVFLVGMVTSVVEFTVAEKAKLAIFEFFLKTTELG